LTAELGAGVPEYVITSYGPDHAKTFTAQASVGGELFAASTGHNKKEAEQAAAATAYRLLRARADKAGSNESVWIGALPELLEVETVRAGLAEWVSGRIVADVEVRHPRAIRRHVGGDFPARLRGHRLGAARRRGKYLWLSLSDTDECLLGHL